MENMGVCTKERKGDTADVLMATPCTNSPGEKGGFYGKYWEVLSLVLAFLVS